MDELAKDVPFHRGAIDFDWSKLDAVLAYGAALKDCAGIMGVSDRTIERRIREKYDMKFVEYRDIKMSKTRLSLQQKAVNSALQKDNTTMLIFCLKNMCGWTDRERVEDKQEKPVEIVFRRESNG